jgi:acyl-CoA hydrolase
MTDIIFSAETNYHDTVFGGRVMYFMDRVATIASMRHSRKRVVTASSSLDFHAPVKLGDIIQLEAFVAWANRSSMEVYVKVEAEDVLTGTKTVSATAFLTFVALDENGKPTPVPAVLPETEEEKRLYDLGQARYEERKKRNN